MKYHLPSPKLSNKLYSITQATSTKPDTVGGAHIEHGGEFDRPLRTHLGWVFVSGQSQQVTSSRVETPSEFCCGYLHPFARDMRQPPLRLRCLSSGNV